VLDDSEFEPAESLVGELEHLSKRPAEDVPLAFVCHMSTVSAKDAELLRSRMKAAAGAAVT
jgi:hypothetical protein